MRAIDADALPVVTECCVDEAGFFAKFNVVHEEDINKAPTLDYKDLVPQGEWIVEKIVGRKRTVRRICSLCGYDNLNRKSNFCPNCGARMKGADT